MNVNRTSDEDRKPSPAGLSTDNEPVPPIPDEESSADKAVKKRTWKKPKDKPKRPLSAYNIFFQHQRSRIVDCCTEEPTPEEIVRSIEGILSKSRQKRRHRKTHGRISFGDLARAIADQWKLVKPEHKAIFDHYAEVDMLRYRRELKVWREKKEMESEAHAIAKHSSFINQMNQFFSSTGSNDSELDLNDLQTDESSHHPSHHHHSGVGNKGHESFNSSFSSVDSQYSLEPEPIQHMLHRQQQILQQQLREVNPNFMGTTLNNNNNNMNTVNPQSIYSAGVPGSNAFHSSFASLPDSFSHLAQQQQQQQQQQQYRMQQLQRHQQQQQQQQHQLNLSHHNSFGGGGMMSDFQQNRSHHMPSSYNDARRRQQQIQQMQQQQQQQQQLSESQHHYSSFAALNSSQASIEFSDALFLGNTNHVSDYSTSVDLSRASGHTSVTSRFSNSFSGCGGGYVSSPRSMNQFGHSSGLQESDALLPPSSFHGDASMNDLEQHQQTNRFPSNLYGVQQRFRSGGSSSTNNTNPSVHDLSMDLDHSNNSSMHR